MKLSRSMRGTTSLVGRSPALVPSLVYDFLQSADPISPGGLTTSATISANGAFIDAAGSPVQKTANVWPLEYDQQTGTILGRPVFELRQNLLLNSLLDGTNLSTQSVTLTAVAHTLSFTGTGTVTLSGASTAGPLVGTGDNNRVSLTFTPSAGSVTFTVTGTVKWANLEIGSFATPFFPTAGAAVTRAADALSLALGSWFNATEGTIVVEFIPTGVGGIKRIFNISNTAFETIDMTIVTLTPVFAVLVGGVTQASISTTPVALNAISKSVGTYKANDFQEATNGVLGTQDPSGSIPSVNTLYLGQSVTGLQILNGWLRKLTYYPARYNDARLQLLTS